MLKINKYIEEKSNIIDLRLKELFKLEKDLIESKLFEAASYSLFSGGKRLRPLLVYATVDTLKGNIDEALDVAAAIEMIHTYSLIHDDLPCMDNDDFRRNKPSLHKAFDEATALLTGDLLLTFAFETIVKAKNLSETKKVSLISLISKNCGIEGMIGGQYIDIHSEGKSIDWDLLKKMHIKKTSSLIISSVVAGGIVAKANEKEITALKNFGEHIGLAFQIVDDILDISPKEKTPISDKKNKKLTAVSVLGLKKAKEMVISLYETGILFLSALSYPPPLLKDLAYKLIKRDY